MSSKSIYHVAPSLWSDEKKEEVSKIYAEISEAQNTKKLLKDMKSHYLPCYIHGMNVSKCLIQYGVFQNMDKERIVELATAGLFLDVGYIKIPIPYLNKSGLSPEEFNKIKQHPLYGAEILKEAGLSEKIQTYVLDHHESPDGNGYLNHKKLTDLIEGQLEIHIADVYEAVQEKRAYRTGKGEQEAYQMVLHMSECQEEIRVLEHMRIAKKLLA